jgi:PAS domain S-box-containing protein
MFLAMAMQARSDMSFGRGNVARRQHRQLDRPRSPTRRRRKKGGDHAIGRSRGGLSTKINALVDERGLPVRLNIAAGQVILQPVPTGRASCGGARLESAARGTRTAGVNSGRRNRGVNDEALPSTEGRFELLVRAIVDYAIYMLDTNGIVTSWNAGAERAKGYSEAEIIGQHFSRFFTPEDRSAGKPEHALKTARENGRFEDEGWRLRKDGSTYWALAVLDAIYDGKGHLIGFAKVTRDMTERRAAQITLTESERRFRLLVTSVVDYALYMLDTEGHVTNWNPGAERLKGYTQQEIIGEHFSRFYTPEDRESGLPARALATALEAGKFEAEGWRVRKDGSRFWASVLIDPIREETGELVGFAKITRDMSERRALDQAKEQLYQAQKMETVGQLTGGVAHDFNNLLTAVGGSVSLIAQYTSDSRVQRLAETAQRAVSRGAKLTGQLLAFARRQVLKPQVSDLNELVSVFEALLRRAVGDTITLKMNLDPGLWATEVDQAQFQSALLNLAINARDALEGKGTLRIETSNVELDAAAAARVGELSRGAYVMVAVSDDGPGMSDEVKARAIEPFYTTKDVGKGTGLGLSQVYGFVRQSHGQLEIESRLDRGTTVRLYLPRSAKSAETVEVNFSTPKGRGTILIVEDDPDVLDVTVETVKSFGYSVLTAENAAEALKILERETAIDVLFSDVVMPHGINGVELAREARKQRPDLRVVLASGYAKEMLKGQGKAISGMSFIAKPYQSPELAVLLRDMTRMDGRE